MFYFKNEARNSMNEYIFRFINIPSTNQTRDHLDTPDTARAGHSQVRSLLRQYPKIYCKRGVILDGNFFLKMQSFLFSLLCIIHIFQHIKMLVHYPVLNTTAISKIQFYVKYMLYKSRSSGDLNKS